MSIFDKSEARPPTMKAILEFDPAQYSERSLHLILAKAGEWDCSPSEAVTRLLDQLSTGVPRQSRPVLKRRCKRRLKTGSSRRTS